MLTGKLPCPQQSDNMDNDKGSDLKTLKMAGFCLPTGFKYVCDDMDSGKAPFRHLGTSASA